MLAGPYCGMQLGDPGADVTKVERPDGGDRTRGWTPPIQGDSDQAAYDLVVQAEGGMMSITGEEGGAPVGVGVAITGLATG